MKTLIIGANGYIGNCVAERFLKEGFELSGTCRSQEAAAKLESQGIRPLIASLQHAEPILEQLETHELIIYTAYAYNNVDTASKELSSGRSHLTDLLNALAGKGKTFILTSGTGVVPDSNGLIYDEDTELPATDSPVTIARRRLEQEVLKASDKGIRSIVLRPPCVYGRGGSFLVPRFLIDHAFEAGESVYVEGSENNKRSAVHVDDLAELFLLAANNAESASLYCTGAEHGIKTLSIAESVSRCAGLGGKVRAVTIEEAVKIFGHWGHWWNMNNQCAGEKARRELGWKPERASLLEEIEHGSYKRRELSASTK